MGGGAGRTGWRRCQGHPVLTRAAMAEGSTLLGGQSVVGLPTRAGVDAERRPNQAGRVRTWIRLCGARLQPVGPEALMVEGVPAARGAGARGSDGDSTSVAFQPCASSTSFRIVNPARRGRLPRRRTGDPRGDVRDGQDLNPRSRSSNPAGIAPRDVSMSQHLTKCHTSSRFRRFPQPSSRAPQSLAMGPEGLTGERSCDRGGLKRRRHPTNSRQAKNASIHW
jgi:hypothetical protein